MAGCGGIEHQLAQPLVSWSGHIVEIQQPVVEIVSQFVHKKSMMVWFSTSVDTARPSWTALRPRNVGVGLDVKC